jgi:hypothetical protein
MADEREVDRLADGGDVRAADGEGSGAEAAAREPLDADVSAWLADYPWSLPLVDPWVEALWHARRGRRRVVRSIGWAIVLMLFGAVAALGRAPVAGAAIACWASFGVTDGPSGTNGRSCDELAPAPP